MIELKLYMHDHWMFFYKMFVVLRGSNIYDGRNHRKKFNIAAYMQIHLFNILPYNNHNRKPDCNVSCMVDYGLHYFVDGISKIDTETGYRF